MAKETKELIEKTFMELLAEKPLAQVSVREITATCGINRNTFYYYYKNIPDLIEQVVQDTVDGIIRRYPPTYETLDECLEAALWFVQGQRNLIYNIYESTNRSTFERHLWKMCDYAITAYLSSLPPVKQPPRPEELAIIHDMLKFEFFGFVIDWINHGMPEDVMKKARILGRYLQERVIF